MSKFISCSLATCLMISISTICCNASDVESSVQNVNTTSSIFDQKTTNELIDVVSNKFNEQKGSDIIAYIKNSNKLTSFDSSVPADYPNIKGVILVTHDAYKNLIPTGHAAICYSETQVVESVMDGVVIGKNNWYTSKNSCAGGIVGELTFDQLGKAADWCKKQLGKPYNFNYFDIATRKQFYCAHLVWASFKDLYNIDLNTSAWEIPGEGNPVHPVELLANNHAEVIYLHNWN